MFFLSCILNGIENKNTIFYANFKKCAAQKRVSFLANYMYS